MLSRTISSGRSSAWAAKRGLRILAADLLAGLLRQRPSPLGSTGA
jgi:hypothetical protein